MDRCIVSCFFDSQCSCVCVCVCVCACVCVCVRALCCSGWRSTVTSRPTTRSHGVSLWIYMCRNTWLHALSPDIVVVVWLAVVDAAIDWEFVAYFVKVVKIRFCTSLLSILSHKHELRLCRFQAHILYLNFGIDTLWHTRTSRSVASADITIPFPSLTNCISTFASTISIISVILNDSEFYF